MLAERPRRTRFLSFLATVIFVTLSGPLLRPRPCAAQFTVGSDLTTRTSYVWRGITLSNRMVVQPAAFLGYAFRESAVTGGVWASLEPFTANPSQLTDAGRDGDALAEVDYWIQYQQRFGAPHAIDAALGFTGYTFHGDTASGGRGAEWDTQEVYGSLRASGMLGPVSLLWSGWKDVGPIGGFYTELGSVLSLPIFPGGEPLGSLMLGGLAGFSWDQRSGATAGSGYYEREGLTHLDFSLAATPTFRIGSVPLVLFTALHVQVGSDERTKRRGTDPSNRSEVFVWFELTASAWYTFGRGSRP